MKKSLKKVSMLCAGFALFAGQAAAQVDTTTADACHYPGDPSGLLDMYLNGEESGQGMCLKSASLGWARAIEIANAKAAVTPYGEYTHDQTGRRYRQWVQFRLAPEATSASYPGYRCREPLEEYGANVPERYDVGKCLVGETRWNAYIDNGEVWWGPNSTDFFSAILSGIKVCKNGEMVANLQGVYECYPFEDLTDDPPPPPPLQCPRPSEPTE